MFPFFFFAHLCNFLCLPLTLYVARCGQNFFHLEECLSKFKKKMQVYISKYEALETQKRGTTMITEEVQNKVKEAIKKLHRRLREPLARHDKCNWRPKRYVVYYGSYVSFLVQTELNRMGKFRFPLTKPEDIDIALDRCADEMCFESLVQSDRMKRKTGDPPVPIAKFGGLQVNLSLYSNLLGRKVLDKTDSDITGINAVVTENSPDDFTVKLNWNHEFEEFIKTGITTCALGHKATDATHIIRFLYKAIRSNYEFRFVNPKLKAKCILTNHFFKPHREKLQWLKQNKQNMLDTQRTEIEYLLRFPIADGHREDNERKLSQLATENGIGYFKAPPLCIQCNDRKSRKNCTFLYCQWCCQAQKIDLAKLCSPHTKESQKKKAQTTSTASRCN